MERIAILHDRPLLALVNEKTAADEGCAAIGMSCGDQPAPAPRIECCSPNECTTNPNGGGPTCKKKLGDLD
jgi:hypothetical protein